jgi:hypothetical protein
MLFGCSFNSEPKEYFVRPCEFVCNYPFNDTTKWVITCRVWGLLKYYHPNVTAGKLDWDKILLDKMEDIHFSSTPETVNAELKKILDAAGEYKYKRDKSWNDSLNMNVNLCWLDNSFLDDTLRDELKKIASLSVKQPSYYSLNFDSTMHLTPQHEKTYNYDVYTLYKYRLLSIFRYWNVIYYFFPNKYLMDKSWDRTLHESVIPFINATDIQSYRIAFLKLAASLNDGHGYISIEKGYPDESQNIIEITEGKTVVKIDRGGLNKGDIVDYIGERDINYLRDSLSVLIPASTQGNREYRINCYVSEMIFFNETDVTVSRNGQKLKIHMLPVPFEKKPQSSYKRISDDIGYVDLSLLTTEEFDLMFESFSDAKSIIFDLRKTGAYKYNVFRLECRLSDQRAIRVFPIILPDMTHPGAYYWGKNTLTVIPDSVQCTRFNGKIVFLINECTQSFTETQAWISRADFHATLIGRSTSGALAYTVRVPLPENQTAIFSGFGALAPDGTELQRKGIIPDIEVYPTLESIKEGKDEILEVAIKYLDKK